jgi:hypothetical protein
MTPVGRINFWCGILAALWLVLALPASFWLRPTYQDFSAFYMGGLIARTGQWDLLYPTPDPQSPYYIGWAGTIKPAHRELAEAHGVKQLCPYLQPPWNAIAFRPLAYLSFNAAHWVWVIILIASSWGVAMLAGRFARHACGHETLLSGAVMLIVAFSPLAYRSIRVGNTSPLVALCIGWATLHLMRRDGPGGAVAMLAGGILKYATGAIVPLALVAGRWRTMLWLIALGSVTVGVSLWIAGSATFGEFLGSVAPTMSGSTTNAGNLSLHGLLLRSIGAAPLHGGVRLALRGAQAGVLILIAALMLRHRPRDWRDGPAAPAAGAALVAWLLVFSPLAWEHYHIYLAPFWGWLLWEAAQSRRRLALGAAALVLAWVPLPVIRWLGPLPEPLNSTMLLSAMLILGLAIARLSRPRSVGYARASM